MKKLKAGAGLLLAVGLAVPLGVLAAVRRNSWLDHLITAVSMFGLSMPTSGRWGGPPPRSAASCSGTSPRST